MTFEEFFTDATGFGPDIYKEACALHDNKEGVACVVAMLERFSETHRVDSILKPGKRSIEALGKWKALQEVRDYLLNRNKDIEYLLGEYRRLHQ